MSPAYETKVRRTVALIRFFEAGGEASAREMAAKIGVSQRTVQRMIYDVEPFVPLTQTPTHRYRKLS